jgi:hypothetical protein
MCVFLVFFRFCFGWTVLVNTNLVSTYVAIGVRQQVVSFLGNCETQVQEGPDKGEGSSTVRGLGL